MVLVSQLRLYRNCVFGLKKHILFWLSRGEQQRQNCFIVVSEGTVACHRTSYETLNSSPRGTVTGCSWIQILWIVSFLEQRKAASSLSFQYLCHKYLGVGATTESESYCSVSFPHELRSIFLLSPVRQGMNVLSYHY